MKTSTVLILEQSDYTSPDGNLRREAFEALCSSPVVIEGGRIIKCEVSLAPSAPIAPRPRQRLRNVPHPRASPAESITERFATQMLEESLTGSPPSFDDISSES